MPWLLVIKHRRLCKEVTMKTIFYRIFLHRINDFWYKKKKKMLVFRISKYFQLLVRGDRDEPITSQYLDR